VGDSDVRDAFFLYWEKLAQHTGWIDLGMGMPPASFFSHVLPIERTLRAGLAERSNYQPQAGHLQVREAIAAYEAQRTGLAYTRDNVMLVAGAIRGFSLAIDCLTDPRTSLVELVPTYPLLSGYARYAAHQLGCRLTSIKPGDTLDFSPQSDELLSRLDSHSVFYLTDPSNPTGRYITVPFLTQCASLCEELGAFMIVDQSCDIPFEHDESRYHWAANRSVIRIRSFSKDLLLAGFRTGYIIASPELIEMFSRRYAFSDGNAPVTVNEAILQYVKTPNLMSEISKVVHARVKSTFKELALCPRIEHLISPEACYYILVKIDYPGTSWNLFDYLLRSGVNVVPGVLFGIDDHEPWIRICCARTDEVLISGLARLKQALINLSQTAR
jgi:aspartate/methionine/tyrosine aminotransferase